MKKEISKQDIEKFLSSAPEGKEFITKSGVVVKDLLELYNVIVLMSKEDFLHHVNESKNDFKNWILHIVNDKYLANTLEPLKTKVDLLNAIETRIKFYKNFKNVSKENKVKSKEKLKDKEKPSLKNTNKKTGSKKARNNQKLKKKETPSKKVVNKKTIGEEKLKSKETPSKKVANKKIISKKTTNKKVENIKNTSKETVNKKIPFKNSKTKKTQNKNNYNIKNNTKIKQQDISKKQNKEFLLIVKLYEKSKEIISNIKNRILKNNQKKISNLKISDKLKNCLSKTEEIIRRLIAKINSNDKKEIKEKVNARKNTNNSILVERNDNDKVEYNKSNYIPVSVYLELEETKKIRKEINFILLKGILIGIIIGLLIAKIVFGI